MPVQIHKQFRFSDTVLCQYRIDGFAIEYIPQVLVTSAAVSMGHLRIAIEQQRGPIHRTLRVLNDRVVQVDQILVVIPYNVRRKRETRIALYIEKYGTRPNKWLNKSSILNRNMRK